MSGLIQKKEGNECESGPGTEQEQHLGSNPGDNKMDTNNGGSSTTNNGTVVAEDEDEEIWSEDEDEDEDDEEEEDPNYYYSFNEEVEGVVVEDGEGGDGRRTEGRLNNNEDDPEYFAYECMSQQEAEMFLQEAVEDVHKELNVRNPNWTQIWTWTLSLLYFSFQISPSESKLLLKRYAWSVSDVIHNFRNSPSSSSSSSTSAAASSAIESSSTSKNSPRPGLASLFCEVCATQQPSREHFSRLAACGHTYCKSCWEHHFQCQTQQGISTSKSASRVSPFTAHLTSLFSLPVRSFLHVQQL